VTSDASAPARISEHVYWLPPGPPDRPSLCAVVGARRTLMLDAGSSPAHARLLLDVLERAPSAVVYTHSHWDHVFGGAAVGATIVAHALTAQRLVELAQRDWSDEGLDRRVADGLSSPAHAEHVKTELPSPRSVEVAPADVVFREGLDLDLGGVTVRVRHVGGDHAADSSVMYVEPDGVLFLGDCLYDSPAGGLTAERAFPLVGTLLGFDAELYVQGHEPTVFSHAEFASMLEKMRLAELSVRHGTPVEGDDEETAWFVESFRAGAAAARPTLFEFAGGEPAFLALARAHHARCVADPELNHPFSHEGQNPQHVERLAAYWAEVMGGPPAFSSSCGDESGVLHMHAGNGGMGDLGERFLDCFVRALDDAALPRDPAFRAAMRDYMRWAIDNVLSYADPGSVVAAGLPMPRWGWDGRQA
jgi:hemoglobin